MESLSGSVEAGQLMEIDDGSVKASPPAGERLEGMAGAEFCIVAASDALLAVYALQF